MIIDTAVNTTHYLPALKAAGVTTVIRYLNPLWPAGEKNIKAEEAHAMAAADMRLALVNEGWGDFAHGGISAGAGERDAAYSFSAAVDLGAMQLGVIQSDACVYFAVDTDAMPGQITKFVLPYFKALSDYNDAHYSGVFRIGVYGSGAVCDAVIRSKHASCSWLACSMGWLGSRAYRDSKKWTLLQHLPSLLHGLDVDTNEANGNFGDFMPISAPANQSEAGA